LALTFSTFIVAPIKLAAAGGQRQSETQASNAKARNVKPLPPEKGRPQIELPDLNGRGTRWDSHPQMQPAVPSTIRSPHKPATTGVGSPGPTMNQAPVSRRPTAKGNHALHHRAMAAPVTPQSEASAGERALARLNPFNQSGDQLRSRDCEWSLPLLNLPGRAGLDLNLTLSYSSMVWTPVNSSLYFDEDKDNISPGFNLGFPRIEDVFFDTQAQVNARLLVAGTGRRTELRQVGTTNVYLSGDSSYLKLTDDGSTMTLRTTDGTQMKYTHALNSSGWQVTEIKDRNGNKLTVTNNDVGDIESITDTLGRVINFHYVNANLTQITQYRDGMERPWVNFDWGTAPLTMNVSSLSDPRGVPANNQLPVLRQVNLMDGSYYTFDYTAVGQVNVIHRYRNAGAQATYTIYEYNNGGSDCPRLNATDLWAENWSGANGVPSYAITVFTLPGDGSHQMMMTDGTAYREYYGSGWQNGLATQTQVLAGGLQKWTTTTYTQDNTGVSYQTNPRVTETNVYDINNNHRRTAVDYDSYWMWGLPHVVHEYDGNGTELRRNYTEYKLDQAYLDARIIGLVSETRVYDPAVGWYAKTTFDYDTMAVNSQASSAPQHDAVTSPRGNLNAVSRWNVTFIDDADQKHTSTMTYTAGGSLYSITDAANHTNTISYTDSFSDADKNSLGTDAYPTTLLDGEDHVSKIEYNYDFGAQTYTEGPPPGYSGQHTHGLIQTFTYDPLTTRVTDISTGGALTHFSYGPNYVESWSSVNNNFDNYAVKVFDGLLRVMAVAGYHPGSAGGFWGQWTRYDQMGRLSQQTNPTEMTGGWAATGDDSGWQFNNATEYDWKSRPTKTYNMDGSFKTFDYAGCGCAGGEVVTLTDEMTRQQRVYSDVLGRQRKTEVLNWPNENGIRTVYSTTTNKYNALDQVTRVRQYAGTAPFPEPEGEGNGYQTTSTNYDGYGRLRSKHLPEQRDQNNNPTYTIYDYNYDDTVHSVTDARGAIATYGYNYRHQVTSVANTLSGQPTVTVSYGYDAVGNRISMTDGMGSTNYSYDQLSRMTSELRMLSGLGSYTIGYQYNLANELTLVTNPNGTAINYGHDASGRLSSVTGSTFGGISTYASNLQYRAWNALKHLEYGNGRAMDATYNTRLQAASFTIPGVMSKTYEYWNDGGLLRSNDQIDHRFDRLYIYDHAARITNALSGAEARGEISADRPYWEGFGYDAMGHLTDRASYQWASQQLTTSDSYSNNRHTPVGSLWQYDADGRLLSMPATAYTYDAAGNVATVWRGSSVVIGSDGDGQQVKSAETASDPQTQTESTTTTYYVRSTVLGGATLTEIDPDNPGNTRTYVYAGGSVLSTQEGANILWFEHRDPSNATYRTTLSNGAMGNQSELDPLEADMGTSDQSYHQGLPDEGSLAPYPSFMPGSNLATTYSWDGIPMPVDEVIQRVGMLLHGPFGVAETLAKDSANDANYQKRWVPFNRAKSFRMPSTLLNNEQDDVVSVDRAEYVSKGYWETTAVSLSPSLDWMVGAAPQNIAGTGPRSIGSDVPGVCSLLVEFRGTGFGEQTNGAGFTSLGGGPHFGLGFTVSGSVTEGGIGVFETRTDPKTGKPYKDIVNPYGTWTVQQWASLSGSSAYDNTNVSTPVNIQNRPDAAKKDFRKVDGNEFVYGDYPGPVTLSFGRLSSCL
jgi:YD repeat-containing protein